MKKLFSILAAMVLLLYSIPAMAAGEYVNDYVGILSEEEAAELTSELEEINDKYNIDAVIVIVNDTGGKSMVSFSDDYFDYGGYGRGANNSGILMALAVGEDKRYLSTSGSCIQAFTDDVIAYVGEHLAKSADEGDYTKTCYQFAKYVDKVMGQYTQKGSYKVPYSMNLYEILIILAIAVIVSWIVSKLVKSTMMDAVTPVDADIYAKGGAAEITASRDLFLYSHVTRTVRERDSDGSGSGGSSTHTSSSGNTHGGGSF